MNTNEEPTRPSPEHVEEQVRKAVSDGRDIALEVERITTETLSMGRLEMERMKKIIEAVGRGASEGAGEIPGNAREAVSDSFEGLQNALLQVFETSKLAIEETVSRVDDYSEEELRHRLAELRDMEAAMLETLSSTAKSATHAGTEILEDLVRHARRSGTRLGSEVEASMRTLSRSLPAALQETALAGFGAARETSARAAEAAGGILRGVANAIRDTGEEEKGKGEKVRKNNKDQ